MAGSSFTSLRGLRSFVAVADIGSFRKSTEALSISQPALNGQIRDLENELGVVLLRSTTRDWQLTENGRGFLARIRRAILDLDTAVLDMRTQAAFESANLTITGPPIARRIGILTRRGEPLTGSARALAEVTRHHLLALANDAAPDNEGNPDRPHVAKGSCS